MVVPKTEEPVSEKGLAIVEYPKPARTLSDDGAEGEEDVWRYYPRIMVSNLIRGF